MGEQSRWLRIGVVSDIHHGPQAYYGGELRKLGEQALELARRFVEEMNERVRPEVVVHLGDAIEDAGLQADQTNYQAVMDVLGRLRAPLLHVTGNHDEVNLDAATLAQLRGPQALEPPVTLAGHRLLVLPAHASAERCWADRPAIERLATQLEEARGMPVVLLTHPSLADQDLTGNPWFEGLAHQCLIEQRAEVRALLRDHGQVRAVIGGHLHWSRQDWHDGIPYFTVQSLIENIAPSGATPRPAAAWALFEINAEGAWGQVAGNQPRRWEID